MREENRSLLILKEVFYVLIFAFAIVGAITIMAYIFNGRRGFDSISLVFFRQIFIYVGSLSVVLLFGFTDIFAFIVEKKYRIVTSVLFLYVVMLLSFRNTMINPFKSFELFIINTIWYFSIITIISLGWFIYQMFVTEKYTKYLKAYQDGLKKDN